MFVLKGRRDGGDMVAFSPDGRTLAVRCEAGLQLWRDVIPGARPELHRELDSFGWFAFAPDGSRLYLDGNTCGAYDLAADTFTPFPEAERYRFLSLSRDGRSLVVAYSEKKNRVECWPADRFEAGAARWSVPVEATGVLRPIPLPRGRFALPEYQSVGSFSLYRFTVRSGRTGRVIATTPDHIWSSDWEAVSPDGRWLAGAKANHVVVWSMARPRDEPTGWVNDSRASFTEVAFHPSGRWLAASATDGTVNLYETESWRLDRTYSWGVGSLQAVAFSPDGTVAAAGTATGRIVVWDVDV